MPTKDEEELTFITDRLSTQVRTIALGILIFVWGLFVGQSSGTLDIVKSWKFQLVGLGGLAVLVMLADFLQYVAAYWNVYQHQETGSTADYKDFRISFKIRLYLFYSKIVLLIAAVVWLLTILSSWLFGS